jgi:F-type H+-transporting ATPase subunit delta
MAGTNVARRYAEALADVVGSASPEERTTVRSELRSFLEAVEKSFDLSNMLHNPSVTSGDRHRVLAAVLEKMGVSTPTSRFLRVVAERGRIDRLRDIIEAYEQIDDERAGIVRAHVTTATPLDDATLRRLEAALEKRTGRRLQMTVDVDPELIAGVRARVGSMVFDTSLQSELSRLRDQLQR